MNQSENVQATDTSSPTKFEILKLVASLAEQESNRYWVRYQMMLLSNVGIWAVLQIGDFRMDSLATIAAAIAGFITSLMWLLINKHSRFLEQRWVCDMNELTKADPMCREWIRGHMQPRNKLKCSDPPIPGRMPYNIIPLLFLLSWGGFLFYATCLAMRL